MHGSKFKAVPLTASEENVFSPLHVLMNAIRFWWVVFLMMFIGGLMGWLIHLSRPPVYEAIGRFSASIDFVSTGPLSQYEEDVALNAIGGIVTSDDLLRTVVDQAAAQEIQTSLVELKENSSVERRLNTWDIRVRDTDAEDAEQIASLWVEQGQAVLLESYQHALEAERLIRYLRSLQDCLAQTGDSQQVNVPCGPGSLSEIQEEIRAAGEAYNRERLAAKGIFYGLTIGPTDRAVLSPEPVIYDRNQMVLAGSLIGLLLGAGLVQFGIPARWLKRD